MIYDAVMEPVLRPSETPGALGQPVGTQCPNCGRDIMAMVGAVVDQTDGSATGRCDRCRAKLRMNPQGYVFLETLS